VLVAGGGVIGLCAALYCAQRGWRVTVVERNAEQRDGCSFQNTGMVVPSHFIPLAAPGMVALGLKWMWRPAAPFYVRPRASWELADWALKFWRAASAAHVERAAPLLRDLSLASQACYEELAAGGEDFGLRKRGMLMLCRTDHGLEEEGRAADLARSLGIAAEVLDAHEAAVLEPDIRMDIAGAVHYPGDASLSPDRLMGVLQRRLASNGTKFFWNNEISGWRVENKSIKAARLEGGEEIEADEFVLCAGSWSPGLARDLGLKLPMQAGKGYSLTLREPRKAPKICAMLTEARIAVSPMDGALRFGGTMELSGLNEDVALERVQGIIDAVPRYYPELQAEDFAGVRPWRGLRPCSPDGLPYLGRTSCVSNLVVATGHAMLGVSLGPITGRMVSQIISGEKTQLDLGLLSPDRYH
jgi:D-amino-acid dehydrogenase